MNWLKSQLTAWFACLLSIAPLQVQAEEWELRIAALLEAGKSGDRLGINGARAKVGVGALIPQLAVENDWFGDLSIGYGYGVEPNWGAELGPVKAKGDLDSEVFRAAYRRAFSISDRWDLEFFAEHRDYELEGTPEGTFNTTTVPIDVDSKVKLDEAGLMLVWHQSDSLAFAAGVSYLDWSVDSTAFLQTLDGRISASIELEGTNTTPQYHLGLRFEVMDHPFALEFRHADLEAEKSTSIPALRLSTDLYRF